MIRISLVILILTLAACSSSNITSEWSCPINQPEGCNSTADGDAIALGVLSGEGSSNLPSVIEREIPTGITPESEALEEAVDAVAGQRTDEEVTAIWVGSFIDGGGNYHPASELYIVLRPSEWRLP